MTQEALLMASLNYSRDEYDAANYTPRNAFIAGAEWQAKAALSAVEQSKEWRDRFNDETELNLSCREAFGAWLNSVPLEDLLKPSALWICYQAARAESDKEIEHWKRSRQSAIEDGDLMKAEIDRLKADREAEMQGLWRIIEGNREEIERLQRVADAAHKTLNDNLHLADGDNCTLFVLREALAAAERIENE